MSVSAVLWDMDGLLIDSEPLWTVAEQELARSLGGEWTDHVKAAVVGTRLDAAVPIILRAYDHEPTPARVAATAAWLLHRMVQLFTEDLPVMTGVPELRAALRDAGVPQALVSSSYRVLVDAALTSGVGDFDVTVAGDEVGRGKPDPEPYLTAAALLGVDPARCVVLEDSPSGATSGLSAGCAVVAVPNVPGVAFVAAQRLRVVNSLLDIDVCDLEELAGCNPP